MSLQPRQKTAIVTRVLIRFRTSNVFEMESWMLLQNEPLQIVRHFFLTKTLDSYNVITLSIDDSEAIVANQMTIQCNVITVYLLMKVKQLLQIR